MKRIAAIVLPSLACELARLEGLVRDEPFAVIVHDDTSNETHPGAILDAVDRQAWQYGVRPGQTASQAAAFVGKLQIVHLARERVMHALGCVAEMALGFGTTAALELCVDAHQPSKRDFARYPRGAGAGPYDTVWLDVTGCARLVGGDDLMCADLRERARQLGHRARVAIASGPRIARAIARWASLSSPHYAGSGELVVPRGLDAQYLAELPIASLPLPNDIGRWLLKLGLLRVEDLARIDRDKLSHRLCRRSRVGAKDQGRDLLELIAGRDDMPLRAYQPARNIIESASFEHELSGTEPLLFVLRGLTSRAMARLNARGEACSVTSIRLAFDRSVIALENNTRSQALPNETHIELELPVPLAREDELLRALHARLERLELPAPVITLTLVLDGLTPKAHHQLDLGRGKSADPNALPTLIAELSAWIGPRRVGVLRLVDSHRPESRSRLAPVDWADQDRRKHAVSVAAPDPRLSLIMPEPTRILPVPIEVGRLIPGGLVNAAHTLYLVDRLRLSARIDRVEWWSPSPVCRDYARAWLRTNLRTPSPHAARSVDEHAEYGEAWMYVDRRNGRGYLQGRYE